MPAIELYELVESAPKGVAQHHFHIEWLHQAGLALLQSPFDQAMSLILRLVGETADADRAWMFRYNRDATMFRNTHEWHREGIPSFNDDLQDVPVTMIAWLQESLVEKKAVMVNDIEGLPRSAKALRAEFERQRDRSVLSVPIFYQGKIWGCWGFDAVRKPVRWDAATARALYLCGELIAAAAQRPKKTRTQADELPEQGVLYLHGTAGKQRVAMEQILCVRAAGDYTCVHLADGETAMELRPLKTWIGMLPKEHFQRIHRGTIVNVRWVTDVEQKSGGQWKLRLDGLDDGWDVSKRYRAEVRSRFGF